MKNRFFYFVILLLAVCLSANANDFKKKRKKQETTPALADALKKEKTEDKSYDKVITKEAHEEGTDHLTYGEKYILYGNTGEVDGKTDVVRR